MNTSPILKNIMDLALPETWAHALAQGEETIPLWLEKADVAAIRRIYLVGCGTSAYAGEVGKRLIERIASIPCEACYAFDLARYGESALLNQEALVIGISTTGGTELVVDALNYAATCGAQTLAVTANAEASVARAAQHVVLTGGEDDRTTVKSKSYVQNLVSLILVALGLGEARGLTGDAEHAYWRGQINLAAHGARQILETRLDEIDALVDAYADAQMVFMLASGPNLGTIHEGALKVIEMAKMYSEPTEVHDFLHGRYREVDQVTPMFLIAPEGRSSAHMLDVLTINKHLKAPTIVITDVVSAGIRELATHSFKLPVKLDELATPLLTILPLHYFAHQMAVKRGWDPLSRRYDDLVPQRVKYGNLEAGLIR